MTTAEAPTPTLIVAGRLHRPDGSWRRGEVWIAGETIVDIRPLTGVDSAPSDVERIDVGEGFVLPGVVDAHVHSLSHHSEGIAASTSAAAGGGVTTIVEMPFDGAGPINSRDRLRAKQDLVAGEAVIDVALLGTLAPGGGWRAAEELAEDGAAGFKVSLFLTDPVRFPRIDDLELLSVMSAVADTGRTLCTHAENNEIIKGLIAAEATAPLGDPHTHSRSRPPVSETLGVLTALEIAADRGTALHLCHLSLPRSIALVRWYQHQGVDVTLETCPHYLTFTETDLERQHGRLKINPPLRRSADRAGLWDAVANGSVSVISSDHAPWPTELKDHARMLDNHSGVPGVETLAAMTLGRALQRDDELVSFTRAVDALTIGPARRYGLDATKGSLEVGKHADLITFEPDPDHRIDGTALHSNAGWSPYDGMRPGGVVTTTVSRGKIVWSVTAGLTGRHGRGEIVQGRSSA